MNPVPITPKIHNRTLDVTVRGAISPYPIVVMET